MDVGVRCFPCGCQAPTSDEVDLHCWCWPAEKPQRRLARSLPDGSDSWLEAAFSPYPPDDDRYPHDDWRFFSIGPPGGDSAYVSVMVDGVPQMRLRISAGPETTAFRSDIILWRGLVVVGFGARVDIVDVASHHVVSYSLDWYFGDVYPLFDCLLVAGSCQLLRINPDKTLAWSATVGLDGVIVHRVEDGVIYGDGEWDPPGGWVPFEVQLDSGAIR